jgi:hypothetical protein
MGAMPCPEMGEKSVGNKWAGPCSEADRSQSSASLTAVRGATWVLHQVRSNVAEL